jgi:hypothetical protein
MLYFFPAQLVKGRMHYDPLTVDPASMPVVSDTVAIKPETNTDYSSSTGTKSIRFYVPPYLQHTLMSQSVLTFDLQVFGRGAPIPCSSAHSLFSTVRTHDGTGAHQLEEVLQYGNFVSQVFGITSSESTAAQRAYFEGAQSNDSISDNLYYGNASTWYGASGVTTPNESKKVQIVMPLKTHLLSSTEYLPVHVMQGLRIELLTDSYLRSLRYTTGSLMVELSGAAPSNLNIPLDMADIPAIGGTHAYAAVPQLKITDPGADFNATTDGHVRSTAVGSISGAVGVFSLTIDATHKHVTAAALYSTGTNADDSNTKCFLPGDVVTLKGASSTKDCVLEFESVNCMGQGRKSNPKVEFEMQICTKTDIDYRPTDANMGAEGTFGNGSVLTPFRFVPHEDAAYKMPFPQEVSPVEVGDILYMSANDGTEEVTLGLVTGLTKGDNNRYVIKFSPNVAVSSDDGAHDNPLLTKPYSHTVVAGNAVRKGISVFVKQSDRVNGASTSLFTHLPGAFPEAIEQAVKKISYTVSNLQYQVKRVFLDEKRVSAEASSANSESGLSVDIPTLFTQMVNVTKMAGPTNQLISVPNITRALSVISVPLLQSRQFDLRFDPFSAPSDDAEEYQYQIGDTVEPQRPVDLTGYTGRVGHSDPLWSVQHILELMKAFEASGYSPTNITRLATQFSIGRAFARKGMFFNLMSAGDLSLRTRYGGEVSDDKLVTHFLSHIRRVFINRDGMQLSN